MRMFLSTKKKRLVLVLIFALTFNYTGNVAGFFASFIERSYKQWLKQWVIQKYPDCVASQPAYDTHYQPATLSQRSTDSLSALFLEQDRLLPQGVTQEVVAKLFGVSVKKVQDALSNRGHNSTGMSMKDFLKVTQEMVSDRKEFEAVAELEKKMKSLCG
uniref:Uncharacterized protein n=1 Tax=Strombidium inclinatum TaxID=197538 RepID=A0A7S3ISD2_9SPIT|mmetsp:Transcript_36810/g.56355  ORF Transcript_36810/g.56355 Transcript_36810/m.56355 type:complete len:159 (+) Transcript_36810:239-715(+)